MNRHFERFEVDDGPLDAGLELVVQRWRREHPTMVTRVEIRVVTCTENTAQHERRDAQKMNIRNN